MTMLHVAGAGVAAVNGNFAPAGEFNGKPRWRHLESDVCLRIGSDGNWCLVNNIDGVAPAGRSKEYYYNTSASDPCCESQLWHVDAHGTQPSPTISAESQEEDVASLWPMRKLQQNLAKYVTAPKGPAVVLTTGGMNPVHLGHVQLLHQASARLQKDGYAVLGAWLSPSHDGYVLPKAKALSTIGLSGAFRLEVARRAVTDDSLVAIGAWEALKPGHWPDYPVVTAQLESVLDELHEDGMLQHRPMVFYACGTDHAEKCSLYHGLGEGRGVVVVPRSGEVPRAENVAKLVFVAEPAGGEVSSFSSTKLRDAIATNDYGYVAQAMSPSAAQFLLQPAAETYSTFASDFQQLGVAILGCQIFISLSSMFRSWDASGEDFLRQLRGDALFFFGSKRSWVFPKDAEELQESKGENPKYTSPVYQRIRDLILQKEDKDQVFFLKPPGFKYNGDLYHGDPGAFTNASDWLTHHMDPLTGAPFEPLKLSEEWWKTSFEPGKAKYTKHVASIIRNFKCGAHDYKPVMELLHQSNPTLVIIH